MSKDIQLYKAAARATDAAALDALFALVPDNQEIRAQVGEPFVAQMYHEETRHDYWVGSDGDLVVCWTIAGVSLQQAAKARAIFLDLHEPTFTDARTIAAVLALATNGNVQLVQ